MLPGSKLSVSRLGLGTVKFGRNQGVKYPEPYDLPDDKTISNLLSVAKELGINLLDTAPAYGTSEERLGNLLKGQRKDWVIISKAGEEFKDGRSLYDFTPEYFERSVTRTLQRLQTDCLDVLLIHSDGNDVSILSNDKLIDTLGQFKKRGLVKLVGASTKTIEGGLKAIDLLDVVMCTPDQIEILDAAKIKSKAIILKKILGSGHTENTKQAIKNAFAHSGVSAAIIGTIKPQHLRENALAAALSPPSSSAV